MTTASRRPKKAPAAGRKPQKSLENPTELLQVAEALAGLGSWSWTRGDGAIACSAGLVRLLGCGDRAAALPLRAVLRRLRAADRRALFAVLRDPHGESSCEVTLADSRGTSRSAFALCLLAEGDRYWGVAQDVTAQRDVSAALDRSESRWEMALESAGQGAWDSDLVTGHVYHSRTWRLLRGMNPDGDPRDTHENWLTRLHPDDLPHVEAMLADKQHGMTDRIVLDYRERRPDGAWMWIHSVGRAVEYFPDGRPRRVIGTDTDVTQRKLDEAERDRLARRLELALEVSGLGVFEANLETRDVFWDRRVRQIYGVPGDFQPYPGYWESALHPDDFDAAMRRVWNAVETEGQYVSDFRIRRPGGEMRNVHTVGVWYRDNDGVPKMLGVNWDVTEEVAAKRELERARNLAEARNNELEATRSAIEHNALHDALTGLPNRRYLDRHLKSQAEWAMDTGGSVSVLHIDLDLFKQINDTLGHSAGDAMLVHVARLLRDAVRPGDFVARVGGDEFSVVTTMSGGNGQLSGVAQRIIDAIRRPVPYEGHFCRFGASVGIVARAGVDVDPQRMLMDADIALYRAKGRGKNRFEFFTDALEAETTNTKRVADDILRGIEQDEFFPYFQPLFDAETMNLVGVEALARWRHPIKGVLPPAAFLRIAEDLNVVTAIDRVILEQALAHFDRWQELRLDVPAVSVNVSFRRLHDQQLLANLKDLRVRPGTLSFELLESIFLDELDELVTWNLDQIRDMGIDINIDDFGTGHASIISLLKLRPRRFKLDRAFLADLTTSGSQRRLVGSIIDIGKSLGIKVVAEGVEAVEQAHILRELGCDILQGYIFARPMPAAELESFLRDRRWRQAS